MILDWLKWCKDNSVTFVKNYKKNRKKVYFAKKNFTLRTNKKVE